ncbi:hypothetical protein KIPB_010085 [Kipferlia bialata]|uniref:ABC transmembrane type-1 domain-containing protein n=1 Tax=Kipferlia bialata TaxID=797122 RepID=A0A9K3D4V0_9EUKA|nr:hypothetical protein KIPB_010085 [Kipferlia bialata]|eukprot:g10085.t1
MKFGRVLEFVAVPTFRYIDYHALKVSCMVASVCPVTLDWAVARLTCAATGTCEDDTDNGRVWFYFIAGALVCVVQSTSLTMCDWAGWELGARWRLLLTKAFHSKYFTRPHFYRLNLMGMAPDQRIAADVGLFTDAMAGSVEPTVPGVVMGWQSVFGTS